MKTIFNLSPLKKITLEQNIFQPGNEQKKEAGDLWVACIIGQESATYLAGPPDDGLAMASRIEVSASIFFMR